MKLDFDTQCKFRLIILITSFALFSCGNKNTLKGLFQKQTPYEAYSSALKDAKLDRTALGSKWLAAGAAVFEDSLVISLPYSETAYFDASEVTANGYRFMAEEGQVINVEIETLSIEALTIFLDLFQLKDAPEHVAASDTAAVTLQYEVKETSVYMLRLQPELLRGGRYQLKITSSPTLAFPVWGKDGRSIASFYGANRDGGKRKHEGIDIFAPRGTPVMATTKGRIGAANTNRLGGKVVWMRDTERNLSYYYAHLDSQMVQPGQRVDIGDTLGLVGNTGNAITTPPHLHFGIYQSGHGAIDPYSYLHTKNSKIETKEEGLDFVRNLVRIKSQRVNFRISPNLHSEIISKLPEHTLLKIVGNSSEWLRAESADHVKGFVHYTMVELLGTPIRTTSVDTNISILDQPSDQGILLAELEPGASLEIYAMANDFLFVKSTGDQYGWLKRDAEVNMHFNK